MSDDQPRQSQNPCPKPESTDVELSEASIKSLGFPGTDRPPTNPFSTTGDSGADAGSDSGAASSTDSE
jgi:hypothetical protein